MIYFVTEAWLTDNTNITNNVDVTELTPWVKTSSDLYIQPILGTYFYNSMLTKFNNQTLNSNELVLLEMIKEAIGWRCVAQTVYPLSRQIKNKGLQSQSGEFSESVDLTEIKFGMSHYAQFAQVYENQIIKYLEKNKNLFPDFTSDNNDDSLIKPITTKNKINNIIII